MQEVMVKIWMWQRLYKVQILQHRVFAWYSYFEDDPAIADDVDIIGWRWLCPKPNLVLVDRKHLGGME